MEDKDFVVYTHNDKEGNIRYIGSGRLIRANTLYAKSGRGKKYKEWVEIHGKLSVVLVKTNLTKKESIELEISLFEFYKNTSKLLNISSPRKIKEIPSKEDLNKLFYYDETSSSGLRWKVNRSSVKAGDVAGAITQYGYYHVAIKNKYFMIHRIILKLHGINIKENYVVDHIDGNRGNNLLSNLRVVSQADNTRNRRINKEGELPIGIRYDKERDRFIAVVKDSSRKTSSGNSVQISKHFLVKKYGHKEALRLAIQARKELLEYIENKNGVIYSGFHKIIDNNS